MKATTILSILTTLAIGVSWISQVHFTAEANAKELAGVALELREMNKRLARIEGKLE